MNGYLQYTKGELIERCMVLGDERVRLVKERAALRKEIERLRAERDAAEKRERVLLETLEYLRSRKGKVWGVDLSGKGES